MAALRFTQLDGGFITTSSLPASGTLRFTKIDGTFLNLTFSTSYQSQTLRFTKLDGGTVSVTLPKTGGGGIVHHALSPNGICPVCGDYAAVCISGCSYWRCHSCGSGDPGDTSVLH